MLVRGCVHRTRPITIERDPGSSGFTAGEPMELSHRRRVLRLVINTTETAAAVIHADRVAAARARRTTMSPTSNRDTYIELLEEVVNWLVGLGLITFTIFPFALPLIALTALLVIPLVLGGILVAILAAPVLLVRRLWRARRRESETAPAGLRHPAVTS
jgi:hypothetical protein